MIIYDIDDLPQSAEQRKTIVVLSEQDLSKALANYDEGQFLLDENICYICKPNETDLKPYPTLAELARNGELNTSSIVMLNPNDKEKKYLPYKVLMKKTIQNQMLAFNELCQLLGAKNVSWSIIESSSQNFSVGGEIKGNYNGVSAGAGAKSNHTQTLLNEMKAETSFQHGVADFAKAEHLIRSGIFEDNACILGFYNIAINQLNRPKQQNVKVTLNESISHQFEALAKVDAPIFKGTIGEANLNIIKDYSKAIVIEYTVEF